MREEIIEILRILQTDERISSLRDELYPLSIEEPQTIREEIAKINRLIPTESYSDHDNAGLRHLLVGCCHFEMNEFEQATKSLNKAIAQIWNSDINKSLAYWLAGMIYTVTRDFPRASNEIIAAYKLIETKFPSSARIKNENILRQEIKQVFDNRVTRLEDTPLLSNIDANLAQENNFRLQEKQGEEEKTPPVVVINENYPVNKLSVLVSGVSTEGESQKEKEKENKQNENRTDDIDADFIYIQSLPVYDQKARAGKSGEIELIQKPSSYTEAQQIIIEDRLHNVHSLRPGTKRINITTHTSWGWMGVNGKSMEKANIHEGDYILFQYNKNASDNDIVIAHYQDKKTTDSLVTVKRFNSIDNVLVSDTDEEGDEYEDILIEETGAQIIGIVYAVAKPVST